MRQPQNVKRGRGRGRRGNGNGNNHHNHVPNRNTSYESNGPDVKLRGNAQQLHEKYMALAHDAATSGERISAEAYTQFSDHYFRLHQAAVGVAETKRQQDHAAVIEAGVDRASDPEVSRPSAPNSDTSAGAAIPEKDVTADGAQPNADGKSAGQRGRVVSKKSAKVGEAEDTASAETEPSPPEKLAEVVQDKAAAS
jgi:hypothetical protein